MYCLDTSILIDIFDAKAQIEKKLKKIETSQLFITPIILCELYRGAAYARVKEKRLEFVEQILQVTDILPLGEMECRNFGKDYLELKKKGRPIKDADLMIAASCKAHNVTLITSDKKHFKNIPELQVEVW